MSIRLEDVLARAYTGAQQAFGQRQAAQAQAQQQAFDNQLALADLERQGRRDMMQFAPDTPTPTISVPSPWAPGETIDVPQTLAHHFIPKTQTDVRRVPFSVNGQTFDVPENQVPWRDLLFPAEGEETVPVTIDGREVNIPISRLPQEVIASGFSVGDVTVTPELKATYPRALSGYEEGATLPRSTFDSLTRAEATRTGQELDERRFASEDRRAERSLDLQQSDQEFRQLLSTRQQDWTEHFQGLQAALQERGANLDERRQDFNEAMEEKRFELDTLTRAGQMTLDQARLELDQAAQDWARERFGIEMDFQRERADVTDLKWAQEHALKLDDQAFRQVLQQADHDWTREYQSALLALQERTADRADAQFDAQQVNDEFNRAMEAERLFLQRQVENNRMSLADAKQRLDERAQDFVERRWEEVGRRTAEAEARSAESAARVAEATEGDRIQQARLAAQQAGIDFDAASRTLESRIRESMMRPALLELDARLRATGMGNIDPIDLVILNSLVDRGIVEPGLRDAITSTPAQRDPEIRGLLDTISRAVGVDEIIGTPRPRQAPQAPLAWPEDVTTIFDEPVKQEILRMVGEYGGAARARAELAGSEIAREAIRSAGIDPAAILAILGALEERGY